MTAPARIYVLAVCAAVAAGLLDAVFHGARMGGPVGMALVLVAVVAALVVLDGLGNRVEVRG